MSSERPSAIPPRGTPQDSKAAREERAKIEQIREVDEDARRRRKFRMMMGDEDQGTQIEEENTTAPSPFETKFYTNQTPKPLSNLEDAVVPSPSYSPPPDVNAAPERDSSDNTGDLPQSDLFWDTTDMPPDQPPQSPAMQQLPFSPSSSPSTTGGKDPNKGKTTDKKGSAAHFGLPGKPLDGGEKSEKTPLMAQGRATHSGHAIPPSLERQKAENLEKPTLKTTTELQNEIKRSAPSDKKKETDSEDGVQAQIQAEALPARTGSDKGDSEKHEGRKEKVAEVNTTSYTNLPSQVQPMAQTAATAAAPYLNPTAHNLFFQMVGTIYVMSTPPGINRTEIVLNSPAFAGSKFFGSTITIEKYATAPDSFNIRLSGTDEAVVAFRENIPSLMSAFQNGKFNFRVNRLEADYRADRPHFRRKEREEGNDKDQGNRRHS